VTQCSAAHRGQVVGEPRVLRRRAAGDVEARVVDGAGQGAAADGLVIRQGNGVDQAELESASRDSTGCKMGSDFWTDNYFIAPEQLRAKCRIDHRESKADMAPNKACKHNS